LEDLIDTLTRGNVTEVKVLLASVALALAVYQLVLIAVGYGKLRPPFLGAGPATRTHSTSAAERDAREERIEQRQELFEQRQDAREERMEERERQ
jgi:hypothetical protein